MKSKRASLAMASSAFNYPESSYDVTTDGQRFLFQSPAVDEEKVQIHVIHNWQRLLDPAGQALPR